MRDCGITNSWNRLSKNPSVLHVELDILELWMLSERNGFRYINIKLQSSFDISIRVLPILE